MVAEGGLGEGVGHGMMVSNLEWGAKRRLQPLQSGDCWVTNLSSLSGGIWTPVVVDFIEIVVPA